jgi:hypothetical protein
MQHTQPMDIYFINTDAISYQGRSYHDEWFQRSIAVTSGGSWYREQLSRIQQNDYVLTYVNGVGVVSIGIAKGGDVQDVEGTGVIDQVNKIEYHKAIDWQVDLRQSPIAPAELKPLVGSIMGAVRRVVNGKEKILLLIEKLLPKPTFDQVEYIRRAGQLRRLSLTKPTGITAPKRTESTAQVFYRDPEVRAWTLHRAGGRCELCGQAAPFNTEAEGPYLESHHILTLAEGGPDTTANTAAVCPNCHRELHMGTDRLAKSEHLRQIILLKESTEPQRG